MLADEAPYLCEGPAFTLLLSRFYLHCSATENWRKAGRIAAGDNLPRCKGKRQRFCLVADFFRHSSGVQWSRENKTAPDRKNDQGPDAPLAHRRPWYPSFKLLPSRA